MDGGLGWVVNGRVGRLRDRELDSWTTQLMLDGWRI